jgi:acyl carrier protein
MTNNPVALGLTAKIIEWLDCQISDSQFTDYSTTGGDFFLMEEFGNEIPEKREREEKTVGVCLPP